MNDETTKINWVPHLTWLSGLLTLAILAQWVFKPDPSQLLNFLSFASSIASLVLAVAAIVYAFVSNNSLTSSVAKISDVSDILKAESATLKESATSVAQYTDDLLTAATKMPESIENMSKDITDRIDKLSSAGRASGKPNDANSSRSISLFNKQGTLGTDVAQYMLAKSYLSRRPLDISELDVGPSVKNYYIGILTSIALAGVRGSSIEFVNDSFKVTNPGDWDYEGLLASREKLIELGAAKEIEMADSYFSKPRDGADAAASEG